MQGATETFDVSLEYAVADYDPASTFASVYWHTQARV